MSHGKVQDFQNEVQSFPRKNTYLKVHNFHNVRIENSQIGSMNSTKNMVHNYDKFILKLTFKIIKCFTKWGPKSLINKMAYAIIKPRRADSDEFSNL